MKILLAACNAKYIHSNLAIFNLKAYAKEYGDNVVLREYTINQLKDDILKDIYRCHPDVVCVSCYIWNITFVRELMQDLRKILCSRFSNIHRYAPHMISSAYICYWQFFIPSG